MIGEVIKAFRNMHNISLREFAKRQGISAATAYRIESGKPMDQRTMSRLIAWLFEPNTPPKKGSAGLQPATAAGTPLQVSLPPWCSKCLAFHHIGKHVKR